MMTEMTDTATTLTRTQIRQYKEQVLPLTNSLYGAAMKLTRDPADAEDLVQDALMRGYRFWLTFEQGTNVKAWMFKIMRNSYINGYHRRGRKREFENNVNSQMRSLGPTVAVANSSSQPPGPDESVRVGQSRSAIREALAQLPADYRQAITLFEYEGLSYKEIAELMECPIGTVMSRIFRGRNLLKKLLHAHAHEIGMAEAPRTRLMLLAAC